MNKKDNFERERLEKMKEMKRRRLIREKRRRQRNKFILLTLLIYVFLILAIFFSLSVSLKSCEKEEPEMDVRVLVDEKNTLKLEKKDIYFDSVLYLPISSLSEICEIKLTGDKNTVTFIFDETLEWAQFDIGTNYAKVNGNAVEISAESKMIDGELFVPFDFFEKYLLGFDFSLEEKSVYTVSRNTLPPSFFLKEPSSTPSIDERGVLDVTESPIDYEIDITPYEKYINPEERDAYLTLVSAENPLSEDFIPTDLVGSIYTRSDRDTRMLREYACMALEAFLKEGEANGIVGVTITSAYRSYEYQNQLFTQEVAIRGSEEEAAKHVNPPGISEHQSGLAVDMHNMSAASTAFGNTKEAKWLAENAHKFGFILRYPKNKTKITGISYEPWHFRYVGRYHATKMYELDMCLEEYIEYIK